jgi:hypothetical protein
MHEIECSKVFISRDPLNLTKQQTKSLNPLRIQYGDYAAWQKKNMLKILKNGIDYWKQELKDIPMLKHGYHSHIE